MQHSTRARGVRLVRPRHNRCSPACKNSRLLLPVARLYSFNRSKRFHRWWRVVQQRCSNFQLVIEGESRRSCRRLYYLVLLVHCDLKSTQLSHRFNLALPVDQDFSFNHFIWCAQMCKRWSIFLSKSNGIEWCTANRQTWEKRLKCYGPLMSESLGQTM